MWGQTAYLYRVEIWLGGDVRGRRSQRGLSSAERQRREAQRGCLDAGEEEEGLGFNCSFVRDGSSDGSLIAITSAWVGSQCQSV